MAGSLRMSMQLLSGIVCSAWFRRLLPRTCDRLLQQLKEINPCGVSLRFIGCEAVPQRRKTHVRLNAAKRWAKKKKKRGVSDCCQQNQRWNANCLWSGAENPALTLRRRLTFNAGVWWRSTKDCEWKSPPCCLNQGRLCRNKAVLISWIQVKWWIIYIKAIYTDTHKHTDTHVCISADAFFLNLRFILDFL